MCRVQGLELRVRGPEFRVQSFASGALGLGFRL